MSRLRAALEGFSRTHPVLLDEARIDKLVALDTLLTRWNPTAGLFSFRTEAERIDRYFLEPLHASLWAPSRGLAVDIGSGGGSPALPLAVCLPETDWRLVEPRRRKALFLEEAIRELAVRGRVIAVRLDELQMEEPVTLVTSRGLSEARSALDRVAAWMRPGGRILLFTGREKSQRVEPPSSCRVLDIVNLAPRGTSRLLVLERFT